MRLKLLIPGTAFALGALAASSPGELPRATMKPRPACGIPNYPYAPTPSANAKPTTSAVTLNRIPANRLPGGGDPLTPTPMVYQLAASRLQLDHCFLSRVAVSLSADGSYEIGFRADQNPVASNDPGSPLRSSDAQPAWTLQTAQLLRNQFIVKVRGYAAYPLPSTPPNLAPGKPVLVEFPIEPFWVERGKPYSGFISGVASDAVRKKFEFIDRIEVEFTYR